MLPGDRRPYLALAAAGLVIGGALVVPATRAWLDATVGAPLRSQVVPAPSGATGYTLGSLAFWALLGLVLAWAAYDIVFRRLGYEADRDLFLALAPFLVVGPLLHALLAVHAFPAGPLAYAAAEPLVYLTTAALALVGYAVGRLSGRRLAAPLVVGVLALVPLVIMAATRLAAPSLARLGVVLVLALVPALLLCVPFARWRKEDPWVVGGVVGAHGLDGATTWMVLRDPFHMGFAGFGEKNPVSAALIGISNGWPYYALKLALPLVLLAFIKREPGEERTRAFLLLAVFVLGYGPGMSNLLQVVLA